MTAGTPAPQDAETVDLLRAAIRSVYDRHDHTRPLNHVNHEEWVEAVLAALAPVGAREVEAARRGGAREALVAAAQAAVTEDQGIPWDHDYDRATVAAWLSERADEVTRSDTADHERTNGQGG